MGSVSPCHLLAFDQDFAGIRAQQSRDDGDGGGFAGAVRSEQTDGLSAIEPGN